MIGKCLGCININSTEAVDRLLELAVPVDGAGNEIDLTPEKGLKETDDAESAPRAAADQADGDGMDERSGDAKELSGGPDSAETE